MRLYWPTDLRPALDSLLAIDDAMGEVVARASQPALAAIKLAWWREQLQALGGTASVEPRLQAAEAELLPRGISGEELAELEDGWAALLGEVPDLERAAARGERLFAIAARLLGAEAGDADLAAAGRLHAAAAMGRKGLVPWHIAQQALAGLRRHRFPPRLRPLTAFARLAARDAARAPHIEPEGTPGRAGSLIAHRLTGRVA